MKQYRCHKVVEAEKVVGVEMHHDAYMARLVLENGALVRAPDNVFRANTQNPIGGYFVRYEDGYTSWSPAEAFERGYAEIKPDTSTALDRAKIEFQQLSDRKDALVLFIQGSEFGKLPELTRSQLLNQARFMEGYAAVLDERIRSWA